MRAFVSAEEMARLDLETMQKFSISSFELMDRVSTEIFEFFQKDRKLCAGELCILCGPGNNGGDGYRLAEKLRRAKRKVSVLEVLKPRSTDCIQAKRLYRGAFIREIPDGAEVVVDAIFGAQGRSDLPLEVVSVLKSANRKKIYRVSVDNPTGIDSLSARVNPEAFKSDLTLCIAYPKSVFISEKVMEALGKISFIGNYFAIPKHSQIYAIEDSDFFIPRPKRTGHKGLYGRVGIVGGSSETPGAPLLSAEAAHRIGAGYVSVYFSKSNHLKIKIADASFLLRMKWQMKDLSKDTALVIGCGGAPKDFKYFQVKVPMVIDADALSDWRKFSKLRTDMILTPHPGEAARILKSKTTEIQRDRLQSLTELSNQTNQSVYLKGSPGLLKFKGESKSYVNLCANSIFSKAGSGDVLSGILGGAIALVPENFHQAIFSGLVFQRRIGEILRERAASLSHDQLEVFSEALWSLWS
jgi:NAD(P)H-hydrate epimerase